MVVSDKGGDGEEGKVVASFAVGEELPPEYVALVDAKTPINYRITVAEGSTSWQVVDKLKQAVEEAQTDEDEALAQKLGEMVKTMIVAGETLEKSGAGIMMKAPLSDIGSSLVECGEQLEQLSKQIGGLVPEASNGEISSQRMAYASEKMIEAGNELQGAPKPKPKGKGWLKG